MADEPERTEPIEELVEHALDVFVYAPIGLLFEGRSILPQLVEKGKAQVAMARMIGQFAVQQGQVEAAKAAAKVQEQAQGVFDVLGLGDDGEAEAEAPQPPPAPRRAPEPAPEVVEVVVSGPAVSDLAIPDYDSLSASQVVNRLAGLTADELAAVLSYERANRGRKTIINKCSQLQG